MIEPVNVQLLPWEIWLATHAANTREAEAHRDGARPRYGAGTERSLEMHLAGCFCEVAVAKFLNLWWTGGWGDRDAIDVGNCVEVRGHMANIDAQGRRWAPDASLVLHDEDRPREHLPHVSAIYLGRIEGAVGIVGWARPVDIWDKIEKTDPTGGGRPAYFVSVALLEDIRVLKL